MNSKSNLKHLFSLTVVVAALGYFVDIYDLLLFGIVSIPSLKDWIKRSRSFKRWSKYSQLANDWFINWEDSLGSFGVWISFLPIKIVQLRHG